MLKELDARENDGLAVTLAWDDEEDLVVLNVVGEGLVLTGTVPPAEAREAFLHPFAYLVPPFAHADVEEVSA